MTDSRERDSGIGDAMRASWAEEDGAEAAGPGYTGLPCVQCGRIRVYLRRDGRYICEKCETFNPAPAPD